MGDDDGVDVFAPCTLGRAQDGDPNIFFKKMNGAGANDMTMMATLTRDSILDNLQDRFVVSGVPVRRSTLFHGETRARARMHWCTTQLGTGALAERAGLHVGRRYLHFRQPV